MMPQDFNQSANELPLPRLLAANISPMGPGVISVLSSRIYGYTNKSLRIPRFTTLVMEWVARVEPADIAVFEVSDDVFILAEQLAIQLNLTLDALMIMTALDYLREKGRKVVLPSASATVTNLSEYRQRQRGGSAGTAEMSLMLPSNQARWLDSRAKQRRIARAAFLTSLIDTFDQSVIQGQIRTVREALRSPSCSTITLLVPLTFHQRVWQIAGDSLMTVDETVTLIIRHAQFRETSGAT